MQTSPSHYRPTSLISQDFKNSSKIEILKFSQIRHSNWATKLRFNCIKFHSSISNNDFRNAKNVKVTFWSIVHMSFYTYDRTCLHFLTLNSQVSKRFESSYHADKLEIVQKPSTWQITAGQSSVVTASVGVTSYLYLHITGSAFHVPIAYMYRTQKLILIVPANVLVPHGARPWGDSALATLLVRSLAMFFDQVFQILL